MVGSERWNTVRSGGIGRASDDAAMAGGGHDCLMIVWGRSISNKVMATGQFYCPGCRQQRAYALRQHQKWGTIYWIPLVPLEKSEHYVEYASCHSTYPEAALRHDPESARDRTPDRTATGSTS